MALSVPQSSIWNEGKPEENDEVLPARRLLNLNGAAICQGNSQGRDPAILLPNQSDDIPLLALDIGGTLIKLVYFSRREDPLADDQQKKTLKEGQEVSNGSSRSYPIKGGCLHFLKFETRKINECLDFIDSKQLHCGGIYPRCSFEAARNNNAVIKATGGGAYMYANLFKERLGVSLDKEDEMDCLVSGANFLLKAIDHEAFTHMDGQKEFVQIDKNDLFPYLLVNIGSGVSIIKVDGDGSFQRVDGTQAGGGTYCGQGMLLTGCKYSFDELLELSQRGDNKLIDLLVGDIDGKMDYSKIGLSASTIASSFGKVVSEKRELKDYRHEDISLSLLRMISYNIGHIAYLNAKIYGLKRIFFGGYFIRGHACIMDTISYAVDFRSKGAEKAMFLRHDGFLGALGAFMSYEKHGPSGLIVGSSICRMIPNGAPYVRGTVHSSSLADLNEKAIHHEAFTHMDGKKKFVQIDQNDMFPYLLVNIGSGVSIIKVDGDGSFQRVDGTHAGGGTYCGQGMLMTGCKYSFHELLELSQQGDNKVIDLLVGDIYGGMDYSKIGLSASTIASSFGKVVSENKELEDYRHEDISVSLLRMISHNIGHIAYLNAKLFGLKRIFFGGYFVRGHPCIMDAISNAVDFRSKGAEKAMFLQHDGFLGVLGAFMSFEKHGLADSIDGPSISRTIPTGAPYSKGTSDGPPLAGLNEKASECSNLCRCSSWMVKFLRCVVDTVLSIKGGTMKLTEVETHTPAAATRITHDKRETSTCILKGIVLLLVYEGVMRLPGAARIRESILKFLAFLLAYEGVMHLRGAARKRDNILQHVFFVLAFCMYTAYYTA
ncbi:hypothetical protein MKW94_021715 [Papaver nudicaule]|uniref:Pantothenate kinase n=1 Tax=Papaver nudicaule TaxID=74823 RepID=A0AA42B0P2_PAPNU|nr:hypothetical protein [Papaver nudicaule]